MVEKIFKLHVFLFFLLILTGASNLMGMEDIPTVSTSPVSKSESEKKEFIDIVFAKIIDFIAPLNNSQKASLDQAGEMKTPICPNFIPEEFKFFFGDCTKPEITPKAFLNRLHQYLLCSDECFFVAVIYICRVIYKNPIMFNDYSFHRLFFTAILIAIKYQQDVPLKNQYYAKVCGVALEELNAMEIGFLRLINGNLFITDEEWSKYNELLLEWKKYNQEIILLQQKISALQGVPTNKDRVIIDPV